MVITDQRRKHELGNKIDEETRSCIKKHQVVAKLAIVVPQEAISKEWNSKRHNV